MARVAVMVLCLLTTSCGMLISGIQPWTESVLTEGMVVSASTPAGFVRIAAKKGERRVFSGQGWSKERVLTPRDVRWYGSLGLYDAAPSFSPHGRLLVNEGRQFFDSEREALRYLASRHVQTVYNNQGLAVGLKVVEWPGSARREPVRTVEIWQIYIRGKKPTSLRGANDGAIRVVGGEVPSAASPFPAEVGAERVSE